MRTARSRTSGENFGDLFIAPSSQVLEPPQNPGRFIPSHSGDRQSSGTLGQCGNFLRLQPTPLTRSQILRQFQYPDPKTMQLLHSVAYRGHHSFDLMELPLGQRKLQHVASRLFSLGRSNPNAFVMQ